MDERIAEVIVNDSGLDEYSPNYSQFNMRVVWRGPGDRYAVRDRMGRCLSSSGKWREEGIPSSRTDHFKKHTRFPYERAMELARREAPKVTCGGLTGAQMLEWEQNQERRNG